MRRRLTLAGLLAVVLATCLLPLPVMAQSTVDGDIGDEFGFYTPNQRSSFYAAGRNWVFYTDDDGGADENMYVNSSVDGITWGVKTLICTVAADHTNASVFFDGTYVHYAVMRAAGGNKLYYRRGTPQSDGSITWSAVEQTAFAAHGAFPYVSADTNGDPWISYGSVSNRPWVTKSSTADGTWSTEAGFPYQLTTTGSTGALSAIIPLTSGRMLAAYGAGDAVAGIQVKRWDGAFWGAERSTINAIGAGVQTWSAVAQDDNVHFVAIEVTTSNTEYELYDYSLNAFTGNVTIATGGHGTTSPVISRTNLNDLYVFVEDLPDADTLYYIKYDYIAGSWGSPVVLVDEGLLDGLPGAKYYLNADYNPDSDKVVVYYVAVPHKLKFKDVNEPVVVTTLEPSAVAGSAATLRGEITSLGTGVPIERGFEYRLLGGGTSLVGETGTFGPGVYNLPVSDLEIDEIYEVRAYVVSGVSTTYGSWLQFLSAATGEPESPEDVEGGMVPPVPTSAPGGWITDPNDRTFDGWFGSDLINSFADTISRSFVWFLLMVFAVGALGIGLCKFTRHLGITFLILGTLLGLFIMGDYLDWFYIFPYLLVGFALIIREGQFSWN